MLGIHRSQLCKNPTVCDSWKEEACCTGLLFPRVCIRGIFILFDKGTLYKEAEGQATNTPAQRMAEALSLGTL